MSKNKADTPMHTEPVTDTITDRLAILSLQAVKGYVEKAVATGRAEYNAGSILVKSQHPLDQCLRRGIIEDQHHESGKRFRNYRDCAVSKSSGRVYNATGEGDSQMDAATIYANVLRAMNATSGGKNQWKLVSIVCFAEPNLDGAYLNEREYGFLYQLALNIRAAFEAADDAFSSARQELKRRLDNTTER